jgi:hypothetical protein
MEARQGLDQEGIAEESSDIADMAENSENLANEGHDSESKGHDPLYVQKRLKQQKRAHEREIRELHERINQMQSSSYQHMPEHTPQESLSYTQPHQGHGVDEQIHKAVSYALAHKEAEERKARDAEQMQHVHRQYGDLHKHLDHLSDKYDDFDDVVRGHDVPFTAHMRDAALLLDRQGPGSAGEVLYKLGKNPDEFKRISQLHPLEQAREMLKLSHALISGDGKSTAQPRNHLGNIKSNPVSGSHAITEKTSVSELRRKMKAGWR